MLSYNDRWWDSQEFLETEASNFSVFRTAEGSQTLSPCAPGAAVDEESSYSHFMEHLCSSCSSWLRGSSCCESPWSSINKERLEDTQLHSTSRWKKVWVELLRPIWKSSDVNTSADDAGEGAHRYPWQRPSPAERKGPVLGWCSRTPCPQRWPCCRHVNALVTHVLLSALLSLAVVIVFLKMPVFLVL